MRTALPALPAKYLTPPLPIDASNSPPTPCHPRPPLAPGDDIPEWFAFSSVVQVLRDAAAESS